MLLSCVTICSLLAASTRASLLHNPTIDWGSCQNTTLAAIASAEYDCGTLAVPLDYTDSSRNDTIDLELARVPAPHQPARGSILFNFGGPGATGRDGLMGLARILLAATGYQYDLVAFDPRGTGNTIPFTCTRSDEDLLQFEQVIRDSESSNVALARLWAVTGAIARRCSYQAREVGPYIGTAFVARDLMSVVDALGEDGLLRYWGLSYGTTLGATVAAMFPDRIDRIIIDGVQNAHEYYHAAADFEEWTQSDEVFSAIWSTCIDAGPERCPLASSFETASEMESAAWNLLEELKFNPIPIGTNESIILDYTLLKTVFVESVYDFSTWPVPTTIVDMLLKGETGDELQTLIAALAPTTSEAWINKMTLAMSSIGIHCADGGYRAETLDEFMPAIHQLRNTSRIMGDSADGVGMTCARWQLAAKEKYEGDFKVKTRNPMLILANTYDGLTPIKSAYNASGGFEGSVVLEIEGYAHSSVALPSVCSLRATAAYFVNGTLPEPGTICTVDATPYGNTTEAWINILSEFEGRG